MNRTGLAGSLLAVRELGARRGVLDSRERAHGPAGLAAELDGLYREAREGSARAREASVAVASWIALRESCAPSTLDALRAAAKSSELELAAPILARGKARAALAPGGRLAEVSIAPRASFATPLRGRAPARLVHYGTGWGFQARERLRMHHDPVLIGRLLDESWMRLGDVLVIASRRPSIPAFAFAVATRDRWFGRARVREALAANPFTPAEVVLALLPSTSARLIHELARGRPGAIQQAAALFR